MFAIAVLETQQAEARARISELEKQLAKPDLRIALQVVRDIVNPVSEEAVRE